MPRHPSHIVELAKRGAEVRLRELVQEAKQLTRLFPHLRDASNREDLPVPFILERGARRARKQVARKRRHRMSAAARKALSQRMKKFWAARRKAAAKA
jgi:hypothetical protein